MIISFKERVKNVCIQNAKFYDVNFIKYEYLVCSRAFENGYHIVKSDKGNYLHLIGVHTNLTAEQFFEKCYDGELEEVDFDFNKPNKTEIEVKGAVRDKIKILPDMLGMFNKSLLAENDFKKNRVECAFATSDNKCTLGFIKEGRPKSLLRGNELNQNKMKKVDLIFKKPRSSKGIFENLVYGEKTDIQGYRTEIELFVDRDFFQNSNKIVICKKAYYKRGNNVILNTKTNSKVPICFQTNTYFEKLKRIKSKIKKQ